MLRPIINAHKNIILTDSGGVWRRAWGLTEKHCTYIVAGVMVGTYGALGVVSFDFFTGVEVLDGLCVWVEV